MNYMKTFSSVLLMFCLAIYSSTLVAYEDAGSRHAGSASRVEAAGDTAATHVYYVSNEGNDGQDGLTPETAWRTLAHVSQQTFQPGDSILLRRGDLWRETLSVTSSGTPQAWITYGAYGAGDKPRILGSEQATGWTQVAPNVWRSGTPLDNPYQGGYSYGEVFFEELNGAYRWGEQKAYDASFAAMTDEYDWSWNANALYIYSPSDPATRYASVEAPQRDSGIRLPDVNGSTVTAEDYVENVAFDNLEIMYTMRHGIYPGYNEVEAHGLRVTNSHIGMIGVKGGSSAYCIAAWHSDMLIQGNTIHDCGRRGVSLNTYTSYTPGLTISDVTIDDNHFYNGFHTTGPDISTLPGREHTFTNFTISNNLFDDSGRWSAGIHDGCAADSCTSNVIYISAHDSHYADFYIYNNVIVGSTSRAMLLVDIDGVGVYHNTVYGSHPDAQPYGLVLFNNVRDIDMRNNIFHGTLLDVNDNNYGRCVLDEGASSFVSRDYNLYFQEDPGQPISGSEHGAGGWNVFMDEWDSWRAASGFEANSPKPQRPLFVDRESGDFRLSAASPALDAGVPIPGVNDDYNGAAPDLGALEFTPALTLHGAPGNQAIRLTWQVNTTLPTTTTWRIDYYTSPTDTLTVTDPISASRAYTLTGLTNYARYTVTLNALIDTAVILSDTVAVTPTDIAVHLPIILQDDHMHQAAPINK